MKFSLLTLLGLVAVAAVGCAALAHPVRGSTVAVFTTTIVLLSSAVISATYCRAAVRAFWFGFAIMGWIYWLLVWVHLEEVSSRDTSLLATSWVLDILDDTKLGVIPHDPLIDPVFDPRVDAWLRFRQTGHCLWALLFALAGGVLARWLYLRERLS